MRVATVAYGPITNARCQHPTHLRIDSLFWGVAIAYLYHYHRETIDRWWAWLLLGMGCAGPPMTVLEILTPFVVTLGFTMLFVGYGCILIAIVRTTPGKVCSGGLSIPRPPGLLPSLER